MNSAVSVTATEFGFKLGGSLVYANLSQVIDDAQSLLRNNQNQAIEIDCESLERVDSAGLALLIEWKKACKQTNKSCNFSSLPVQAISLIETYRLQQVI